MQFRTPLVEGRMTGGRQGSLACALPLAGAPLAELRHRQTAPGSGAGHLHYFDLNSNLASCCEVTVSGCGDPLSTQGLHQRDRADSVLHRFAQRSGL